MVELRQETDERLWHYLTERLPDLETTPEARRVQLLRLTRALLDRPWPTSFILSGVRATADVLDDLESLPPPDDVMQREEVRRFIAENRGSQGPRGRFPQPERETRRAERDRLFEFVTRTIRAARSAKARHEVKKTRRDLLRIDQREVRRVLGRDADDLCHQINTILRATAAMF
jgi:hypothetical protein